jgi:site-specific DNA-cytosine methylase
MNVLSLFDGISAGQVALERAGIEVTNYYASEIDKYAIKVTMANHPNTIQLGDVTKWREWDIDWSSIDLLIGGSPCQGFSFAGKQLAFDDPRSALFFVFVDILNHIRSLNPDVKFLLENVKMKKEHLTVITEQLGVEPCLINSALLSAQNRQRYYWTSWEFGLPGDKGILLADIIEDGGVVRGKAHCIDANYYKGGNLKSYFTKNRRQLVFTEKSLALLSTMYKENAKSMIKRNKKGRLVLDKDLIAYRKLTPTECERLQTFPDGYTAHVSNTQRYKALGNSWTVDVIAHILRGAFYD